MSTVKPEIQALADVLLKDSKLDGTKVQWGEGALDRACEHLGVTAEEVKRVHKADLQLTAAVGLAGGTLALDGLKENASLDRISGEFAGHGANYAFDTRRETTVRNVKTGETSQAYGASAMGMTLVGAKGSLIAGVKSHLKAEGAARFAAK